MSQPTPSVNIEVLGGPTVVIDYAGLRFLTDPTFDPAREYEVGPGQFLAKTRDASTTVDQVMPVDVVLLSHDEHPDNLDLAGRAMLAQIPTVLTTPSAAGRLGGNSIAMAPGATHQFTGVAGSNVTVTAVSAQHGPEGCGPYMGEVIGFVLQSEQQPTIYISGDNASLDVVQRVAATFPHIDIAVLFAGAVRTPLFDGALLTMNGERAAEAARILGAKQVIAAHVDSWGHFTEGRDEFVAAFSAAGLDHLLTAH